MKKLELHLDAIIVITVVFVLALGFITYQRQQYSKIMQENIDLAWENGNLASNLALKNRLFDSCQNQLNPEHGITSD